MKLLTISQVKPGMITARSIADRTGAVLTNVGVELTDGIIEKLKSRRVEFVYVQEDGESGQGASESEIAVREAEIDRAVELMFADHAGSEVMVALAELGKKYRKRKLR